jgi:hypothetical protein
MECARIAGWPASESRAALNNLGGEEDHARYPCRTSFSTALILVSVVLTPHRHLAGIEFLESTRPKNRRPYDQTTRPNLVRERPCKLAPPCRNLITIAPVFFRASFVPFIRQSNMPRIRQLIYRDFVLVARFFGAAYGSLRCIFITTEARLLRAITKATFRGGNPHGCTAPNHWADLLARLTVDEIRHRRPTKRPQHQWSSHRRNRVRWVRRIRLPLLSRRFLPVVPTWGRWSRVASSSR